MLCAEGEVGASEEQNLVVDDGELGMTDHTFTTRQFG